MSFWGGFSTALMASSALFFVLADIMIMLPKPSYLRLVISLLVMELIIFFIGFGLDLYTI